MKKEKQNKRTALSKSAKSMVSLMLLLIAMLMPQGAWAADFISEIKVSVHKDKGETARNKLTNDGYQIVNVDGAADLNGGGGGHYVYIGYKTSTNAADAITGLLIVESATGFDAHAIDNITNANITYNGKNYYRCANYDAGDARLDCDLNRGRTGKPDIVLFYTKDGNTTNGGTPLTSISVVGNTTTTGVSYTRHWQYGTAQNGTSDTDVYGNTNQGGTAHYITYTTHTHSYNNSATFNWASDGKTCTADIYCTCGDKHTGIACTVTSAVKTPATCSVKGWTTYTAKVTYNGKNFSGTKDMQDIPLAEHTFNANGICTRDASHFQEPALSSGYYQIANYGNLCWFRDKVNGGSYTINAKQTADVTIPDGVTWDGIGHKTNSSNGFKGTYDGNCHTISGLKISQLNTAFFNTTNKATIKNLGLLNVSVSSNQTAGLVRTADNSTTINNCYVTGSAERPLCYTNTGNSTITNCFANVTNGLYIVASNYATITNCYTNLSQINNSGSGTASNCRTGVNAATFASGEITYLLNSGKTDGTQVWYQKLGNGGNALPTLVKNISNTVYKLENLKCDGVTKNGSVSYGNSSTAPVDAHNWTNTTTYSLSAADCTHDAVYYKACSVCNVKGSETWTKTGTALGHSYGVGSWSWADDGHSATCTRTCSRDANHKSSASVTLGNGITSEQQVAPNCTTKGTTRYTATATVEGTRYNATKDVVDIAALGHDYSQVVDANYLVSAATCIADAVYHEKCSRCTTHGAEWSATGTATGNHNYTNNTLTASPIEDGLYAYACDYGCGTHTDDHIIKDFYGEGNHLELTKSGSTYSTTEDVIINDGASFASPVDFTAASVTFNRYIINDGGMWSFIVPFDIPAAQAAQLGTFYQYRTHGEGKVHFDNIARVGEGIVRANTAYFFEPTTDFTSITVDDAEIKATTSMPNAENPSEPGLYGTYSQIDIPVGAYGYAMHDGQSTFVKAGTGNLLRSFRAYLWLGSGASMAKVLAFFGDYDDITGINNIETDTDLDMSKPIYTLSGQRIMTPKKGEIYIQNGKKVMKK